MMSFLENSAVMGVLAKPGGAQVRKAGDSVGAAGPRKMQPYLATNREMPLLRKCNLFVAR
jgi:hypothetical protein